MVVPDPPLSRKQDKDDVVLIASTHSPTPSQRFSQFKGSSSSLTSQGDSAIPDEDIVTNTETSHLSNLALFGRNKTPSESVWTNIYSSYSKVRTPGSQRSSNSCQRKSIRNKNLKFDVKYGIACAIPEPYDKDTYSCQDSEYSYSDTPVSDSNHNISVGVNGFLSSFRHQTSNFSLISVGKGLQHQVGEGQGTLFYQSEYSTQDLPESSSVASGSSKRSSKNSNLRKEAFSASRTESVKPFFCLYGKIIHTDDCKCLKINLWKRCLLPGCHPDKVSNTDTITFGNIYQNNLDEDVYDVDKHVSSLSEEITADTSIAVSRPKIVTESIHSGQSCTQKLEPVCESAKETDNQLIQYGLETDWGIGEEITQQYNSEIADLRVFSPETALPLSHQTPNYSSREESQSPFVSESESLKVEHFRHTYDNVKNLPFESDTSAWFKGKVPQVTEPSPRSAWSEATSGLAHSLYNVADFVQYTQAKNNIKSSERPAKQNDLESSLALFDNLLIDIDDQLERKVPHTSENSITEQLGLYPWAALNSQSTTTMASQGKKNKNQFVRKAAPASPVNNTGEGGSSRFSSTDDTSKGMRLAEVSIDCSSHGTSQKDMNVTNKIELTQGSPPEFGLEQHGIPPDAGVGDAPHILGQSSSLGHISTPSVNIQYSEQLSFVPRIHSHPYSSPSTGSTMHSAYSDSTGKYGTPNHDKTQSLVPPAKPPRTFLSDTMGQHSASSIHKDAQLGSAQMFSNARQQQSSRLQRQGSQQFANNFDDDGQGYLGRLATDNPLTASDEYLEEQARRQYEGPEIWFNNGQTGNSDQSSHLQRQVGQNFPFHMNAQEQGQYPSGHLANKTHYSSKEHKQSGHLKGSIPRVPNAGKMGQTSSSYLDNWVDEMQIGQIGGQMEQQQSLQHRGYRGDGQQERLRQMPGTEHGRSLQPAQIGLNDGIVGPMHPQAQLNEMQANEQGFNENVQGVQNQQWSKAQDRNIPKDRRPGNDQSSDTFFRGEGVSDYTRKSTYISDRELAQEQFDQRMNNPWFQEMVQNIQELAEREGLIIKDVFPDGNCLFTAVVDQLRVRGNFKYTPSTLRAAAVDYLIKNSKQRDGTPLEHFLSNETWEHYLGRMRRDGEWGEHIILGAISEVLRCRINVLGGISGKSFTVVQPQYMSDKEEEEREKERKETKGGETTSDNQTADKTISENPTADTAKSDKSPSKDETNSETSQSKTVSKPAKPHTCEQSKSLHTGSASLPKPNDAKVESTDTSLRKDQTAFRSKQNWDKENEELSQGEELFIGLLGEMHYVSLRKKDWEERLHEKLWARIQKREAQRKERSEEGSFSDDDMCLPEDLIRRASRKKGWQTHSKDRPAVDGSDDLKVVQTDMPYAKLHLDFLIKYIFNSSFIWPEYLNGSEEQSYGWYSLQIVGIEYLPCFVKQQKHSSLTLCFDSNIESKRKKIITGCNSLLIPRDTMVIREGSIESTNYDLILCESKSPAGFTRLIPVCPYLWYPVIVAGQDGNIYLKHLHFIQTALTKKDLSAGRLLISFRRRWQNIATEWLTRHRPAMWPDSETVNQVAALDAIIIPKGPHTACVSADIEWNICFGPHERLLMKKAVTRSQRLCFLLLRMLVEHYGDQTNEGILQILKTVFFYACESIPAEKWDSTPAWCLYYITSCILHHIETGSLPHYFISTINLLKDTPQEMINRFLTQTEIIRCFQLSSLYFLCDELGFTYKEPGRFMEEIFVTLASISTECDEKSLFIDGFCPELIHRARAMTYEGGLDISVAIFISLLNMDADIDMLNGGMQTFTMLQELPEVERWCLAFCIDRVKGTNLAHMLFSEDAHTMLSYLIGPNVEQYIEDVAIPTKFTDFSIVCIFLVQFACVLSSLGLDDLLIEGLKFYLQNYQQKLCDYILQCERCLTNCRKTNQDILYVLDQMKSGLLQIYTRLYLACAPKRQQKGVFDGLETVAEHLCSKRVFEYLAEMHRNLGNEEKMQVYQAQAASL